MSTYNLNNNGPQMNEHNHGLINPNSLLGIMFSLSAIFLNILAKIDMGTITTLIAIIVGVTAAANNIVSLVDKLKKKKEKDK